jgi:hypothetical protein
MTSKQAQLIRRFNADRRIERVTCRRTMIGIIYTVSLGDEWAADCRWRLEGSLEDIADAMTRCEYVG